MSDVEKSLARPQDVPSVCFFAWLSSSELFETVDFYRNDITILRDLGFHVHLASRPSEILWNADVYVTWWWGGGILTLVPSLLRRRPNVFFGAHHYFQPGWDFQVAQFSIRTVIKRLAMKASLRFASANVFISTEELAVVNHLRVRNPRLMPLAVDYEFYRPGGIGPGDHILTITHLTEANVRRKMVCEIVEAFALVAPRHPDLQLIIVGEKADGYPLVQARADRLGVSTRVTFTGRIDINQKLSLLQRARLYLQPTYYEGFGLAIAEAMACEIPVVVTRGGAVEETVGSVGVFAQARTPEAIAEACLKILSDPNGAALLGREGRTRVIDRFSFTHRHAQMTRLLSDLRIVSGSA